jgi:hypothetical protein
MVGSSNARDDARALVAGSTDHEHGKVARRGLARLDCGQGGRVCLARNVRTTDQSSALIDSPRIYLLADAHQRLFPIPFPAADNLSSPTHLPTRLPPPLSIPSRAPSSSQAAPPTSGSASTRPRPVPSSKSGKVTTVRSTASSSVRTARCLRVGARTARSGCGSRGQRRMGCGSTTRTQQRRDRSRMTLQGTRMPRMGALRSLSSLTELVLHSAVQLPASPSASPSPVLSFPLRSAAPCIPT